MVDIEVALVLMVQRITVTYRATTPTGKLRMNEGTNASRKTTNMWTTVYVALSGFGLSSVRTFRRIG